MMKYFDEALGSLLNVFLITREKILMFLIYAQIKN